MNNNQERPRVNTMLSNVANNLAINSVAKKKKANKQDKYQIQFAKEYFVTNSREIIKMGAILSQEPDIKEDLENDIFYNEELINKQMRSNKKNL